MAAGPHLGFTKVLIVPHGLSYRMQFELRIPIGITETGKHRHKWDIFKIQDAAAAILDLPKC